MNQQVDLDDRRAGPLAWAALTALWLVHAISNFVWLKIDTRPPFWDTAGHAITSIDLSQWLVMTDLFTALKLWFTATVYPPLVYWLSGPLALLFWPTADVFVGIHAPFVGILIISTYGVAARFGGRKAGLLAAFIVSMYPLVYGLERHFLTDVPLVAMVALSSWLLIRSDGFERPGASVLCGVALGLGLLTKWAFVIFAGGPFFVAALAAVASRSGHRLRNLGLALLVASLVAGPWYLVNLDSTLDFFGRSSVYAQAEGDPAVGSLDSWLYYPRIFVTAQVLLPFAVLFALSLMLWLAKRRLCYESMFLLGGWIVLPYLASSFFFNKDPRYTMPCLPAVAIITALGLLSIKPPPLKVSLVALLGLYASFQFLGLTWGLSNQLPTGLLPGQIGVRLGSDSFPVYTERVHLASPPRTEDWQVEAILNDLIMLNYKENGGKNLELAVLTNTACFEQDVFKYYIKIDNLPIKVVVLTGVVEIKDARVQVLTSDYLVTKTGDLGPVWSIQQSTRFTTELHNPSSELGRHFEQVGEYPLPDGSTAELYQRTP